ncbi:MAG: beta-lactamase family protein [Acidimicrobiales bacterium]|jgi:CubicO group peptidase (beta-lactamase class C family)|nr:beta-lactamase family protein [Acidimicrobiales bacterium]
MRRHAFPAALLGLAILAGSACSSDSGADQTATGDVAPTGTDPVVEETASPPVAPDGPWEAVDPAEAGFDAAALDELPAFLDDGATTCVAVVKDGKLAGEWYFGDFTADSDQEIFSASKSVSSTLVGIAEAEGYLDIDQPASDFITEWQGTDSESVTIRNLISNDSGRFYTFENDYVAMAAGAPDKTAFSIGLSQQYPAGEHWEYNNAAIQTLEAVLERATGRDMVEYAQEKLFEPIGMDVSIKRDAAGNPLTFMGVQAGCGDAARFGWLFEQDGSWNGEQVVPAAWVEEATQPSQDLNKGYGFLWWLNSGGEMGNQSLDTLKWPDAPTDAYAALGLGGQVILVIPSQDLVVVRLGGPGSGGIADQGADVNEMARLTLAALQG